MRPSPAKHVVDWSLPYASRREPVLASNIVATSQPLAAQAGLEMLRAGGNAAAAAVAAAACLTVVEPTSNGIGGDGFFLVWTGGGVHAYDGSGRSPAALTTHAARARFDGLDEIPFLGWGGVTVPGAPKAWADLAARFATRPLTDLLAPAIRYADNGFPVSPQTAYSWQRAAARYLAQDARPITAEWARVFTAGGRAPNAGELWKLPDHARTLDRIAQTQAADFYEGELASKIVEAAQAGGWPLARQDLAAHAGEFLRPISTAYAGVELHEIPPAGQGIVALIALGIMRHLDDAAPDPAALDPDTPAGLHRHIEAMKLAFADGRAYIADRDHMRVDPAALLDDDYLASRARLIAPARASQMPAGDPRTGGTVYLTTADASGMIVSYIQSNYTGFGSGVVVPGTGIALHNRGCCFTLQPDHPNEVGPAKRPYHTIIPGLVTRKDSNANDIPVMGMGVMGGFMQPQGHAQVVHRVAAMGQNPQAALDAPRYRVEADQSVVLEPGFDPAVEGALRDMGHAVSVAGARTVSHGRGQIAYRMNPADETALHCGASDQRADGQAAGF